MEITHLLALLAAGLLAGFVNAVAGGGTILTFPTLILLGENSVQANATSTLALIMGIGGSVYGYRRQIPQVKQWLLDFTPGSIIGGLGGGILLTITPTRWFDLLVPYLLLFATVLFLLQGFITKHLALGPERSRPTWRAILGQFFIAIYGGYFGAGVGILMLATLGLIGLSEIIEMNAVKTVLGGLINVVAALYFICKGLIDWPKMWILALGALPGYYLGSVFSQKISPTSVRRFIGAVGLLIAAYLFWQRFH